jgi:ribosomal protein S18 acetylase RimI-like enzyme
MPVDMTFSVRIATSNDAPGILDCLGSAFAPHRSAYTAGAFADTVLTPETLALRMTGMRILVAVDDLEGVVGTIAFNVEHGGAGHIRGMAVRGPWQGQGVADQLLGDAESQLRSSGCARVSLDTTAPLKQAIRFYERRGFVATGRCRDFYGMDLFEYAKDLCQPNRPP